MRPRDVMDFPLRIEENARPDDEPRKVMYRFSPRILFSALLFCAVCSFTAPAPVRGEETDEALPSFWVDDDLEKGLPEARKTKKPLLIVFRCPP